MTAGGEGFPSSTANSLGTFTPSPRVEQNSPGACILFVDANGNEAKDVGESSTPPFPCVQLRTEPNPDGSTTVYADQDGDSEADSGEPMVTAPGAQPKFQHRSDGTCILYNDGDGDGIADAGEIAGPPVACPDPQVHDNSDGTCTPYTDSNQNGSPDPGETQTSTPCPTAATQTNPDGTCTAYLDTNNNGQPDSGEPGSGIPCPDPQIQSNPNGSLTLYDDKDHDGFADAGEGLLSTPSLCTPAIGCNPQGGIISNGVVQLGVNPTGQLNVPGAVPSGGVGTTTVGLRYLPSGNDAVSPGCECEGWGAAYNGTVAGYANNAIDGIQGMNLVQFRATPSTALSVVQVGNLRVTHDYHPNPDTPYLYEITVTLANTGSFVMDHVQYRRVVDWDVEPTAFDEFVSLHANSPTPSYLVGSNDNGFSTANPLVAPSSLSCTGPPAAPSFDRCGPGDLGGLLDFDFGDLAPNASHTFYLYYGAAGSRLEMEEALTTVGAEAYSLGEPSTDPPAPATGAPNTPALGVKDGPGWNKMQDAKTRFFGVFVGSDVADLSANVKSAGGPRNACYMYRSLVPSWQIPGDATKGWAPGRTKILLDPHYTFPGPPCKDLPGGLAHLPATKAEFAKALDSFKPGAGAGEKPGKDDSLTVFITAHGHDTLVEECKVGYFLLTEKKGKTAVAINAVELATMLSGFPRGVRMTVIMDVCMASYASALLSKVTALDGKPLDAGFLTVLESTRPGTKAQSRPDEEEVVNYGTDYGIALGGCMQPTGGHTYADALFGNNDKTTWSLELHLCTASLTPLIPYCTQRYAMNDAAAPDHKHVADRFFGNRDGIADWQETFDCARRSSVTGMTDDPDGAGAEVPIPANVPWLVKAGFVKDDQHQFPTFTVQHPPGGPVDPRPGSPLNGAGKDDPDDDGIEDREEIRVPTRVTNPWKQDTDGDGLKDGAELKATDPLNPDTNNDGASDK